MALLTKKAILFSPPNIRAKSHTMMMKNVMVMIDAILPTMRIDLVTRIALVMIKAIPMRKKTAWVILVMTVNTLELMKTNLQLTKMKMRTQPQHPRAVCHVSFTEQLHHNFTKI